MQSPFGGWHHHLARWEACHWIRGSRGSPMNPVPLPPPQFGGAAKGKRLNGQARRLTSPHLEVLCRTSTVAQQNAPSFRAKRSGAPKSPRTMALAVSRGYVSRRNASLTSDRLTSSLSLSLLPQISNLKSLSFPFLNCDIIFILT